MSPKAFDVAEPGTDEATWLLDPRWDSVPAVTAQELLAPFEQLVVLVPHPDDESLALGGTIAAAAAAGLPVDVVVASDGECSHPEATMGPERLAALRHEEVRTAVGRLGEGVRLHQLGLPDGGLAGHVEEMAAATGRVLGDGPTLVVITWARDGHPDHEATAEAAGQVAATHGAELALAPVWLWHWGTGDDLPWGRVQLVDLGPAELAAKASAIAAHRSQVERLGPGPGEDVLLGPHVLARFRRTVETLVRAEPPAPATGDRDAVAPFDEMYEDSEDPWSATSWYEQRKRTLSLAVLARERYGRVLDLGCATGELARELAVRADAVTAVDHSAPALDVARSHPPRPGSAQVRWLHGTLPSTPQRLAEEGERYDLVVLSEVGYFLRGSELLAVLRAVQRLLTDDGELVLVDWAHPTEDIPLDGPLVHAQVESVLGPPRVRYRDADVLLDVWGGQVR